MWVSPRSGQRSLRINDARGSLSAAILIAALLIPGLALIACHKKTPAQPQNSHSAAPATHANAPAPSPDEQSCKTFVQNFYDWYWNRYAQSANSVGFDMHSLPSVDTVLKHKPPVLSPELSQMITDDQRKKLTTHETAKLDFDPFWGNQNAQGMYIAGRVHITGDRCKVSIPQGDEIAELQKSGSSWVFVNFYYCFAAYDSTIGRHCPDSDLLQILKQ
ncbi:MAG: hypothetical protein WA802_14930 [Terracidiphilus sp.]